MIVHILGMAAAIAGIALCVLLPVLPGRYHPIAGTISAMAQRFGHVGPLLVPVGILWLVTRRRALATAALVVGSFVWIIVSLAGLTFGSMSLGVCALVVGAFLFIGARRRLRTTSGAPGAIAWYLIIVPIAS